MELPEKLKVGYKIISVESKRKGLLKEYRKSTSDSGFVYGLYDKQTHRIWVNTEDIAPREVLNSLLHESMHACLKQDNTRMYILNDNNLPQDQKEEFLVDYLAGTLCQLLVDNPSLIEYIKEVASYDRTNKTT